MLGLVPQLSRLRGLTVAQRASLLGNLLFVSRLSASACLSVVVQAPASLSADPVDRSSKSKDKRNQRSSNKRRRARRAKRARSASRGPGTKPLDTADARLEKYFEIFLQAKTSANDSINSSSDSPSWKTLILERIEKLKTEHRRQTTDAAERKASTESHAVEVHASEASQINVNSGPQGCDAAVWTSLRAKLEASVGSESAVERDTAIQEVQVKDFAGKGSASKKSGSGKSRKSKGKEALDVKVIHPSHLHLRPVEEGDLEVPQLSYNLDRVLFNPGVYHMQDHRSNVFNFDPYLASIMPVQEFDFDALKSYITSSKDVRLRDLSAKHGKKYCGSTSSMTSILAHFHFLLSAWRQPNFENLSRSFEIESKNFTALTRGPAAAFAHYQDGVYAIDTDKSFDTENVLSMLGKSMEKLLTLPKESFERYHRARSHQIPEEEKFLDESYHYTTMGDFMMRSQLDAFDPRLPGTGMFDLKTRAVVSIRMDVVGYEKGVGYEIRERFGQWESFEREYYDMIRAAFLKYSLQVRMGRMDGIFVAFHNTQRIFGFQYISLSEMDHALHGTTDLRIGDQEFKCSVALLNELLDRATKRFPGRTLRLHVETRPIKVPLTYFFVEPVSDEKMRKIQEAAKPSIERLRRKIFGLTMAVKEKEKEGETRSEEAAGSDDSAQAVAREDTNSEISQEDNPGDPHNDAAWKEMMAKVEATVENESLGVHSVREAVQDALEQMGLLKDKTEIESEECVDNLVAALTANSLEYKGKRDGSVGVDGVGCPKDTETDEDGGAQATLTNLILKVTENVHDKSDNFLTFQRMFADLATGSSRREGSVDVDPGEVRTEEQTDDAVRPEVAEVKEPQQGTPSELFGMYVTIRNKVNGQFVERPSKPGEQFDWSVQYNITEVSEDKAQHIYKKVKKRRSTTLGINSEMRSADWYRMFSGSLPIMAKKGEKFRAQKTIYEANNPVRVAWNKLPLPSEPAKATDEERP